ncbi:MAG TPA: SRPBCC family protein [Acidimicrobiales bacterium]|nr:SRPBCC family protein [Acidimicrobiales bacterium]
MTEQTTQQMVIAATPEQCWAVVTDFAHYPAWAGDLKSVVVHERDDRGRGLEVTFRAAAFGRSTSYTLRYDYAEAPRVLSWVSTAGDITSRIDGTYVFEEQAGTTLVTYHLAVDLRLPVPSFIKRRAEGRIIHTALRDLKARVEGA